MLKQKFLVHFGSNLIVRIAGLFAGIIVARIAGPEVVGMVAYGTAYVGLWGFISGLFGSAHIKLISEGQDIGRCMAVYSRLFWSSVSIYFMVVLGFFLLQKYIFHVEFESTSQQLVILILLSASIFEKYYGFSSTTFTATMEQAKANLPFFVKTLVWHLGRILVVVLGFKAVGLAAWNLVITILLLPLVYNLIKKYHRTDWDHELFKQYVGYAVPILLIVVINSIVEYSDKLFLAHYTDTTELGYYSAANSIGGMVMLASVAVGNVFFPLFSSYLAKNDWAAVSHKIMQYQEFLAVFVFPSVCAIVMIASPLLTTVLGPRYEPSIQPFMIIAFATYVVVVGMPYGNTITGAGRFYLNVWINVIKLAGFAVSITIFVSPMFLGLGAVGLALNLLAVNLLTNFLYLYFSRKLSGLSFFSVKNSVRYLVIFSSALLFYVYQDTYTDLFFLWWIGVVPVYMFFVYGVMFALKLVDTEQVKKLFELLNLHKVFVYIKDELIDNKEKK